VFPVPEARSGLRQDIPKRRRLPALALLGLLPTLGGVIPILDYMVGDGRPAAESEHIPGTHGFPHNHFICIQQQANQGSPSGAFSLSLVGASLVIPELPFSLRPAGFPQRSLPRSRSPPAH
jgi:hypothetical protein